MASVEQAGTGHRTPQFGLLAVLDNRRAEYFRDAATTAGLPTPVELDWSAALDDPGSLAAFGECELIRVDAAGEDAGVTQRLISLGGHEGPPLEHGEFRAGDAIFTGMERLFNMIADTPPWTVPAQSILAMFDKWATHQRLSRLPVSRPPTRVLTAADIGTNQSVVDVLDSMDLGHRLFLKPRFGSSASGVCALWRHRRGYRLITPTEIGEFDHALDRVRLYNTLRMRSYSEPSDIETILRAVVASECVVERWLPKATLAGQGFDLRVVVIGLEARHVVLRSSRHPMTNLHLGSDRGDVEHFMRRYGLTPWRQVKSTAEVAASAFPDALVCGVDVLLDADLNPFVLEVNSFGDLLPGILSRGQSTYEAVVDAMLTSVATRRALARHTAG